MFDFYLFFSLFSINLNLEVLSCTVASEGKVNLYHCYFVSLVWHECWRLQLSLKIYLCFFLGKKAHFIDLGGDR